MEAVSLLRYKQFSLPRTVATKSIGRHHEMLPSRFSKGVALVVSFLSNQAEV
jgi:hypothetical protein